MWGTSEVSFVKKAENYQPIVDCNLRFQNQWEDKETGLYYNLNRYYDPDSGQYLSTDPVGLQGGLRTHGYVHDPMQWVDPLGLTGCQQTSSRELSDKNYLYRGVSAKHPEIANAKRGIVRPGNIHGTVAPEKHNRGRVAAESPYTSWTRDQNVAKFHAGKDGPGGVVLRAPQGAPPPGATWKWEWSPDEYNEQEVLLRGVRTGLEVL